MPTSERGFTYLPMLFALALGGAVLAAAAPSWQAAAEREREAELAFRGNEFRQALLRYQQATPEGQPRWPVRLEQLLADERGPAPRHWLRRLYADPFTGQPDWQLLRNEEGGITGVASRSERVLRGHSVAGAERHGPPAATSRASDWHFSAEPDGGSPR